MTALQPWIRGNALRAPIRIRVEGQEVEAEAGECLATALAAAGILWLGSSPAGRPRGAFCMMGVCQQCVALVDGVPLRTCMVAASEGMEVGLETPPPHDRTTDTE